MEQAIITIIVIITIIAVVTVDAIVAVVMVLEIVALAADSEDGGSGLFYYSSSLDSEEMAVVADSVADLEAEEINVVILAVTLAVRFMIAAAKRERKINVAVKTLAAITCMEASAVATAETWDVVETTPSLEVLGGYSY